MKYKIDLNKLIKSIESGENIKSVEFIGYFKKKQEEKQRQIEEEKRKKQEEEIAKQEEYDKACDKLVMSSLKNNKKKVISKFKASNKIVLGDLNPYSNPDYSSFTIDIGKPRILEVVEIAFSEKTDLDPDDEPNVFGFYIKLEKGEPSKITTEHDLGEKCSFVYMVNESDMNAFEKGESGNDTVGESLITFDLEKYSFNDKTFLEVKHKGMNNPFLALLLTFGQPYGTHIYYVYDSNKKRVGILVVPDSVFLLID